MAGTCEEWSEGGRDTDVALEEPPVSVALEDSDAASSRCELLAMLPTHGWQMLKIGSDEQSISRRVLVGAKRTHVTMVLWAWKCSTGRFDGSSSSVVSSGQMYALLSSEPQQM